MKTKGFTLIELVVVIVVLGVLAVTVAPKYIDLEANSRTTTLEAISASMEGAAALVHGKSLVKGNHKEPFSLLVSPTVDLGGTQGSVSVHYGYPLGNDDWERLIDYDKTAFKLLKTTDEKHIMVYPIDGVEPTNTSGSCIAYYSRPTGPNVAPTIGVNEC